MIHPKDPAAIVDFTLDWDDEYLESGETIATSSWSVTPSGLTIDSSSKTDATTTVFVSGGTAGSQYRLTNRVVTSMGRTDDKSIMVKVQER